MNKSDRVNSQDTFVNALWEHLISAGSFRVEKNFSRFVAQHRVNKWIVATDFCIDDAKRPTNAFAFIVFPAGIELEETHRRLDAIPTRDLKEVQRPSNKITHLLRKGKIFTFCFLSPKTNKLFPNAETARATLGRTIAVMESWQNANQCQDLIKKVRAMRVEASKNSLSLKLLTNIVLCTTLVAYVTALICKCGDAEIVGWAPDRDKITESYSGIASTLFSINVSALSERMEFTQPKLGIFTQESADLWCDRYVRIADFVAGAAACLTPPYNHSVSLKVADILKAFADNKYLSVFLLEFWLEDQIIRTQARHIAISRAPFN